MNATDLWMGAASCAETDRKLDTNYLLLVGQIRAMTDMSLLDPLSDEEGVKATNLYALLYSQTGGGGFDEVYRSNLEFDQLLHDIAEWQPLFDNTYDPGWMYKPGVEATYYSQMIECQKASRISQLEWYGSLLQNDEYYALHLEQRELMLANQSTFEEGTPEYEKVAELASQMHKVSSKTPPPSTSPPECDFIEPYKPDPDANFRQVYVGYNGPPESETRAFSSAEEVSDSWLAKAVGEEDLVEIVSTIDFEEEILVLLNFGPRTSATGTTYITDVNFNTVYESLSISGLIGVNEEGCSEAKTTTHPFVLAIAERPPVFTDSPGYFSQNFPDGCKEAVSSDYFEKY